MKKFSLLLVVLTFPMASWAWIPAMSYFVNHNVATVQVQNYTAFPAYCEGLVFGTTQTGITVNAWFSGFIPPFGYQNGYVYANGPYFFVNAWAQINCRH